MRRALLLALAVLGVACLQRPAVGMQALVLGQQRRVDVERRP